MLAPLCRPCCLQPPAPGAFPAPIHACIGNAGMGLSGVNATHMPAWAQWQMNEYGYSTISIANATTLTLRFYKDTDNSLQHTTTLVRNFPREY